MSAVIALGGAILAAAPSAAWASVSNDAPAGAIVAELGVAIVTDSTGAEPGLSPGEPAPSCADATHTLWYSITVPTRTWITLSSFGSKVDTVLAVYDADLVASACIDDDLSVGSMQSRIEAPFAAGTYLVQLGTYAAAGATGGPLRLHASASDRLFGDSPDDPIDLDLPSVQEIDLAAYSQDHADPGCLSYGEASAWFRVTPTQAGVMNVLTGTEETDMLLGVYDASLAQLGCADGWPIDRVSVAVQAGQTYLIGVGYWGYGTTATPLELTLSDPAINDERSGATPLPMRTELAGTLSGGSRGADDPVDSCFGDVGRTVWFTTTVEEAGSYIADITSAGHMHLAVYRNDAHVECEGWSFTAEAGDVLTIAAWDHGGYVSPVDDFVVEVQRGVVVDGVVAGAIVREDGHVYAAGVVAGVDVDPEHQRATFCAGGIVISVCESI